MKELIANIEAFWSDRSKGNSPEYKEIVFESIRLLNEGKLRVCEKKDDVWQTNEWLKKAILLYFTISELKEITAGDLSFYDKIPTKSNFEEMKVRAVPTAIARYGSYIAPNVILMPSYVNIGAYVDSGTMVDTWATVGSCAQIGKNVHLSGGVGIGGVLEPLQANPVIIEDDCFIGSRSIIVEGAFIDKEVVIGANTVITSSTQIIDVTGDKELIYKGYVPPKSVVIPGTRKKTFPAGEYDIACAYIIGKRKDSTDKKTSLNDALRMTEEINL
ncbi:2,3,4,5-tetrahydropyridine-2,6-dicarboxylate N-succinyltransferase [Bacteroidales bacterium OttesenSCG-928-K03]|nr:2,3,4,5-tetrahydropyridine-2,6-dicarboxylate N-succinyltransferase [Odoribacter sp. OttesenSCG-928-L07]MDL2238825.1 2,3,4,5-tetrahydropyridine-2,6-dicarboxylate N-succinyltransferase [Bacteroidales bacterium OttesenSCG-928-L14]MDL2240242.1 2,3,4,5-tetrahydropyridine-2,6-dicarboxylate N-succinyltransferase [Bacteroidales bacterium OttesenSCG-928-K22]MDL2242422.1 2,3,4,5-tetrahydropyridine-2,6-dicarboxylate N-succinyltransferase [Bacteroidales bacterium OttesenSCG-928-K03]